jgi:hypothetical protein
MNKKTFICLVLLILSPLVIYFLWPSDEHRLKKLFREGAQAIEQEDIDDVMSKFSFHYRDEQGLSYLLVKEMMERVFTRMSGMKIEYEIKKMSIQDASAFADLDFRVIEGYRQDRSYAAGDATEPARMKIFLEKERGRWLIIKTEGLPVFH